MCGRSLADLPVLDHEYAVGPPDQRRPMGHDDARDRHLRNEIGDRLFRGLVEIGGALVEHENARPAVERARQQHALALAARERRSHVADQAEILHRRAHDVVVHLRRHGRLLHPLHVEVGIEEGDVVGDRAGEEPVVLRDHAHMRAPRAPQLRVGAMTVEIDGARGRPVQAEQQLQQRRLAAARGAGDGDEAAGLDIEVDVLEDELVGGAVAKARGRAP